MKKHLILSIVAALGFAGSALAKDVTLHGEGKAADKCQNVLEVTEGGTKTTYYLKGEASDKFHKEICGATKSVEASGSVSDKDGKKWLTVSSIKAK